MDDKNPTVHSLLSHIHMIQGDHKKAIREGKKAVALGPNEKSRKAGFTVGVVWALMGSTLVKIKLDRLSEARQDAEEILKIWPWYNLDYVRSVIFYKDSENLEHWIDGLRKAGIPEK